MYRTRWRGFQRSTEKLEFNQGNYWHVLKSVCMCMKKVSGFKL